jgi:hypothetical protein
MVICGKPLIGLGLVIAYRNNGEEVMNESALLFYGEDDPYSLFLPGALGPA